MKATVLILGLFIVSTLCFGQKKKYTRIIITPLDTTNIIERVSDALNERGYTVDQQTGKFISTKEKSLAKASASTDIKLKVFYSDGQLSFSGEFRVNVVIMGLPPAFTQIENRGAKGSVYRVTWQEMEELAKQFGSVKYL
jgi:hypothetical protein